MLTTAIRRWCLAAGVFGVILASSPSSGQIPSDPDRTIVYRDADRFTTDDFVITQNDAERRYGRFYNATTKSWDYGWYSPRDYVDDAQRGDPHNSFYWKRDFGWYFDPTAQEWRYGFHYNDDFDVQRDRLVQVTTGPLEIQGRVSQIVPVRRGDQRHVIALLDTSDRGRIRVDLGDARQFAGNRLMIGDNVTVVGQGVGPRADMVLAERISTPAATIRIAVADSRERLVADRPVDPISRDFGTHTIQRYAGDVLDAQTRYVGDREHLMVRIVLSDGKQIDADLGPTALYAQADLRPGAAITVLGTPKGETIHAAHVRVGNLSLSVPRNNTERTGLERRMPDERAAAQVKGVIRDLYRQEVYGEEHLIANVETDEGRLMATDLGPTWKAAGRFNDGDQIAIDGSFKRVAGETMLVADQVEFAESLTQSDHSKSTAERLDADEQSDPVNPRLQGQIVGRIEAMDQINMLGQRHTSAQVRLEDGRLVQVDFGPAAKFDTLRVNKGDLIAVSLGSERPTESGVLVAEKSTPMRERPISRAAGVGPAQMLEGRVLAVREERLAGFDDPQLTATIQLVDGTTRRVLLGAEHRLQAASIRPGAEVHIRANRDATDPALFIAQELRLNGKTILGVP